MLDRDFCEYLEYLICKAFKHLKSEDVRGFWCDGVLLNQPDNLYSQKYVIDNRQVSLKAFIGKDGQTEHELILLLGNQALSRFERNLDIKECVPNPEKPGWFSVDEKLKRIEIQLD